MTFTLSFLYGQFQLTLDTYGLKHILCSTFAAEEGVWVRGASYSQRNNCVAKHELDRMCFC